MAKYTVKDLPFKRFASTPVYVEDIEKFGEASEIFQLFCAVGYGDGRAAVKIAKYIIARSPLVKGTSLDPNLHRVGPYMGYSGNYGIDRAVAFLEYAVHLNENDGEAHYYLGHCFEKEMGWHYVRFGNWDRDYRDKKSAKEQYEKANSCGFHEAYLALSFLLEGMFQDAGNLNFAAYCALNAVAYGVNGARERYSDLKRRGFDGGNLLSVFRASHPNVRI